MVNFEHLAADDQTLETWIGRNATRYPNSNALTHVLPYIFFEIFLLLGNLQRVTTRYRQIYNIYIYIYIYIYILFFLKKNDSNALQIAQN